MSGKRVLITGAAGNLGGKLRRHLLSSHELVLLDRVAHGDAATKLVGERLGRCVADAHGLEVIAVRLGWNKPGDNLASAIAPERGEWFRLMWLANRDYCHLMERCLLTDLPRRFVVINGMS